MSAYTKKVYTVIFSVLLAVGTFFTADAIDMNDSVISIDAFSPALYTENQSVFIISSSRNDFSLPETPFQKPSASGTIADKVSIMVTTGAEHDISTPNPSVYLADTRLLNLSSPEITGLSARFVQSSNPVADIEQFVYEYIDNKTYGIPIIAAKNIVKLKAGDCTEHSVLTVSLLRKRGIPARAAVGIIAVPEFSKRKNVFVFHMWAEAFVDNKWILVDSSFPGKKKTNRYITFTYHNLRAEMPMDYLAAVSAIMDLKIKYVK